MGTRLCLKLLSLSASVPKPSAYLIPSRNTWTVRHAKRIPNVQSGTFQKPPSDKQEYQMYQVVEETAEIPPVKVILTKYVEGYGNWGDIISVPSEVARNELVLSRSAVYATPFDVAYFEELRKRLGTEKKAEVKLSLFSLKTAKKLKDMVFVVSLNLDQPWTLDRFHIRVAMRLVGIRCPDDCILLPEEPIVGPDLSLENKLFRFHVVVNKQIVTPCVGRIHHVTTEEARRILSPEVLDPSKTSEEELKRYGLDQTEQIQILERPVADVKNLRTKPVESSGPE